MHIGYFLKRNGRVTVSLKGFLQELYIQLLEVKVIIHVIGLILRKKITEFDALVGDAKCQVRCSIIMDLITKDLHSILDVELNQAEQLSLKIQNLLNKINRFKHQELKDLSKFLRKKSLKEVFIQYGVDNYFDSSLVLLGLCFFTKLNKEKIDRFVGYCISSKKIRKLMNDGAKNLLCEFSLDYEKNLALRYGSKEEQAALEQVEVKGFCFMTSFFPSFVVIFKKMKQKLQSLLIKMHYFCQCGGFQNTSYKLFQVNNGMFVEQESFLKDSEEIVMVIEGYQYPGSFKQLKVLLGISELETVIDKNHYELCNCSIVTEQTIIFNIENAILANFAQHRQFTNDMEIDFCGLGIEDSKLRKEYEYLKTLNGFSIDDMSKFAINHIYANTIAAEMESSEDSN